MAEKEFIEGRERQLPPDFNSTTDVDSTDASAKAMRVAPLGEPPDDYTVRSVYDSRPVNGFDFTITSNETEISGQDDVSFQVPQGYVCVLRRVYHALTDPPANTNTASFRISLRLNGANVPYNQNIPVGPESDIDTGVRCFLIADEFDIVGARFIADVIAGTSLLRVSFYGNFLLKTGRPANFEIANQAGGGKTASIQNVAIESIHAGGYAPPSPIGPNSAPLSTPNPDSKEGNLVQTNRAPIPREYAGWSAAKKLEWSRANGYYLPPQIPAQVMRGW